VSLVVIGKTTFAAFEFLGDTSLIADDIYFSQANLTFQNLHYDLK